MALDQVKEHAGVAPVVRDGKTDPFCKRDLNPPDSAFENFPDGPADRHVRVIINREGCTRFRPLPVFKNSPVLGGRVVYPDGKHPVHHLVVTDTLDLRKPPDAPLRNRADLQLPFTGECPVFDRLPEVGGGGFEQFLHVVGETDVIKEEDGACPQGIVVEERLIRDGALQPVLLREQPDHCVAGMGLALAGGAGDGDVQAGGVLDGLGGNGHDEAFCDRPVTDMFAVEYVEEEGKGVACGEDFEGPLPVFLTLGRRVRQGWDRRQRGEGIRGFSRRRGGGPFRLRRSGGLLPARSPGVSFCFSFFLIHRPEFRPPLAPAAAGVMVAPGEDGTVCKLDGKRPVGVCRREGAPGEREERTPVPRFFGCDGDAVVV